jgi:hypothetical protein
MSLSRDIFREKDVASAKGHGRSVAKTDFHRTGKGNDPLAAGRRVPVKEVRAILFPEYQMSHWMEIVK